MRISVLVVISWLLLSAAPAFAEDTGQKNNLYGNPDYAEVYKTLYGDQWKPESEIKPTFKEGS